MAGLALVVWAHAASHARRSNSKTLRALSTSTQLMQAHSVSRRLSNLPHHQNVLNRQLRPRPLARPVAPPLTSASTSASFSSSKQAPQSSPRDADGADLSSQYTNDGSTTYRTRPGSKRALPLPPLMDPIAISARERWTEPKKPAPAAADLTPFQQKLYQNAYGKPSQPFPASAMHTS